MVSFLKLNAFGRILHRTLQALPYHVIYVASSRIANIVNANIHHDHTATAIPMVKSISVQYRVTAERTENAN